MTTAEATTPRKARRIAEPRGDRAFNIINYTVLAVFTLSVLYPLIYVISSSFSSAAAINSGAVKFLPVGFNVDAYQTILESPRLVTGFMNSAIYAVAGGLLGTALTVLAGYPLSRDDLPFRRVLTFFFLIPTLLSAGIIPTYIVVRQLGLLDTRWAIILPGCMSVFNMIITRTFYKITVPSEMLEAAKVDGASDFRFFFRIALPLSKPIIAVNLLFYGIAQWNGWFSAFIYLTNADLYPLQLVLREILAQSAVNPAQIGGPDVGELLRRKELFDKLKYALIVIAMVPPLIAYPFVQKHFVKGALIGSLK
ncbi:multiple sugar transport system permease protein/putative aldouronate transport system permease protein [Microlunatus panaciterrae]|uniref:Multiple sugar transport system permease protein/putative aldouronate transport system permease protein n=1 Tax=Microlunatus panaciterrae TaxID=400768 RepID=A0ABS2RNR2_9ACTN|nr:multiple sugar transport system permease protein/putative aldouronate transport system permease protein [Microlunatus panaciterrae]